MEISACLPTSSVPMSERPIAAAEPLVAQRRASRCDTLAEP